MASELPREWEGRDVELTGVIDELLPQPTSRVYWVCRDNERVLTLTEGAAASRASGGWQIVRELQSELLPTLHAGGSAGS